jgi:hypothetical protein
VPDFWIREKTTDSTVDMHYVIIIESGYSQSSTELRDPAYMWLTLDTVICVITVDFRTKQFPFPNRTRRVRWRTPSSLRNFH